MALNPIFGPSADDVGGLQEAINTKASTADVDAADTALGARIDDLAVTDVDGLQTALDGKTTESYVDTAILALRGGADPAVTIQTLVQDIAAIDTGLEQADLDTLEAELRGVGADTETLAALRASVAGIEATLLSDNADLDTLQEIADEVAQLRVDVDAVDQTYDAASTDAQAGVAVAQAIAAIESELRGADADAETLTAIRTDLTAVSDILTADDADLDTAQERIDRIKALAASIAGLAIGDVDGLQAALDAKASDAALATERARTDALELAADLVVDVSTAGAGGTPALPGSAEVEAAILAAIESRYGVDVDPPPTLTVVVTGLGPAGTEPRQTTARYTAEQIITESSEAETSLTLVGAPASGRDAGRAATFAALPTHHSDGSAVSDGDAATLTSLDGDYLPGHYRRVSGAWELEEWFGADGVIDVTRHGVAATPASVDPTDSANSADFIDSGVALNALRDKLIGIDRSRHWTLVFPATDGCYQWKNNRWLYGLLSFTIEAKGARMQCIHDGSSSVSDNPWLPRNDSIFTNKGDAIFGGNPGTTYVSGDLIDTAEEGVRRVVLSDAADASNYYAGQRVIIHSYVQQSIGYSPNLRYFEWHVVTDVSGAVVSLSDPLTYEHRADNYDILYSAADGSQPEDVHFGKARILSLDGRSTTSGVDYWYHEAAHFEGGEWLCNPNFTGSNGFTISAKVSCLKNMYFSGRRARIFPRESQYFTIENVVCDGEIEADKIIDYLRVDRSRALGDGDGARHSIKAGTGANIIELIDTYSAMRINMIAQERLVIRNCTAFGNSENDAGTKSGETSKHSSPILLYGSSQGGKSIDLIGGRLRYPAGGNVIFNGIGGATLVDFVEDVVDSVDGSSLLFSRTEYGVENENFPDCVKTLRPGFIVRDDAEAVIGVVERVSEYSTTHFAVLLDVTGTMPVAGDTIKYRTVQRATRDGAVLWDEAA